MSFMAGIHYKMNCEMALPLLHILFLSMLTTFIHISSFYEVWLNCMCKNMWCVKHEVKIQDVTVMVKKMFLKLNFCAGIFVEAFKGVEVKQQLLMLVVLTNRLIWIFWGRHRYISHS